MEVIKKNILYIQASIKTGKLHAEKPMLTVLINEAIEEIENTTFQMEVFYANKNWKEHFTSYSNLQKKYKATLLCDLQELRTELNKKNVNELKCLVMLAEMIDSNLYTIYVKSVVDNWKPKNGKNKKSKVIDL